MATRNTIKTQFKKNGYALIKNFFDKQSVEIFTQYALFKEGFEFTPEGINAQVPNAHSSYGDPLAESLLLWGLEPLEQHIGMNLHPTYSYYRVYRNGSILKPHKDRPSCEISMTVCMSYQYEKDGYNWPIRMDGTDIVMEPGDAVVYRGCDLEHSREMLEAGEGAFHVQTFLHYVNADGPYSDYKYDNRVSLGLPATKREIQQPKRPYIFKV